MAVHTTIYCSHYSRGYVVEARRERAKSANGTGGNARSIGGIISASPRCSERLKSKQQRKDEVAKLTSDQSAELQRQRQKPKVSPMEKGAKASQCTPDSGGNTPSRRWPARGAG